MPRNARIFVFQMPRFGNAISIVFPDNTAAVIDWGIKNPDQFRSFLDTQEISRLRFVMATHAHTDHVAGLPGVLKEALARSMPIDNVFLPPTGTMTLTTQDYIGQFKDLAAANFPTHELLIANYQETPQRPQYVARSNDDQWEMSFLAPSSSQKVVQEVRAEKKSRNPENASCVVMLFRYLDDHGPQGRALLPGDATKAVFKFASTHADHFAEYAIDNDVVIAPHHGSKGNWPDFLYNHVKGLVVVSSGPGDAKLPAKSFLQSVGKHCRLANGDSSLFCTSYAHQCRLSFAKRAKNQSLVAKGPCFGNMIVELKRDGSRVVHASSKGEHRRPYGHCGQ